MTIRVSPIVCAAVLFCAPVFSDPINYMETFNGTSNPDWGIDYGIWSTMLGSNFDEDGAKHSQTGGYSGGYGYIDHNWAAGTWYLLFADSDASGGSLAGNKDYTGTPFLQARLQRYSVGDNDPDVSFFFVSEAGSTISNSSTLWLYNTKWSGVSTTGWDLVTADLTDSSKWTAQLGGGTPRSWSDSIADVDLVGIMFLDWIDNNSPEIRVDNFAATPEPASLLMMGPLASFLGWRLLGRKRRRAARGN